MNLRRQLLLVSLLTLILPWAGCQFIRETESALREGQQRMLAGTALAIADSLSQFPYELLADADDSDGEQVYGHPLASAPLLDGYMTDWGLPDGALVSLRGTDGANGYVAGVHRQQLYLYLEIRDADIVYAGPQKSGASSDAITLVSVTDDGQRTFIRFAAEAPGELIATRSEGEQAIADTRITGFWRDAVNGYRLEARIPRNLLGTRVGLIVSNTDSPATAPINSLTFSGAPGRFVTVSPVLQSVASGYAQPGLRLIITDRSGWRLAVAGSIATSESAGTAIASPGWLRFAYNLLLEPGAEAELAEPHPSGREQQPHISAALAGRTESHWFRSPDTGRAVVAVAQPVWSGPVQTGALILQQGTDAILSLTNQALSRLIVLTLVATVGVALVLLGYASWLSFRIRRLSTAAEHALDEKRVHAAMPSALDGDEVGDLSRSFSSVLRQLGAYNDYLQSLASKLSHELRTPLTIVKSSLENLEHESLSNEAREYTSRAREGTERLQAILNAMSEASRTEELMQNAEPERFDIASVLKSTAAAYADAWTDRKFAFESSHDSIDVDGVPELIIQMVDKLVDNAVDFTNADDTIEIRLAKTENHVDLVVENPGPPLPEDMQARLFQSMVSLRGGETGKHLGLGLHIARLVAVGHGGSITAENTIDGVAFTVRLPLATKNQPE